MAIIGPKPRIALLATVIEGLKRAGDAVVQIRLEAQGEQGQRFIATGYALTPRLIMTAGYVLDMAKSPTGPPTIWAAQGDDPSQSILVDRDFELLGDPLPALQGNPPITLLRVSAGHPFDCLPFSHAEAGVGDDVQVVQFAPDGRLMLSAGRTVSAWEGAPSDGFICYDSDTEPGAGGAPVLDSTWRVIAIHSLGQAKVGNAGVTRHLLVEALSRSRWWSEIADQHDLADVSNAPPVEAQDPAAPPRSSAWQVRAALASMIDPEGVPPARRAWLEARCTPLAYLDDQGEDRVRWAMRLDARHDVLALGGGRRAIAKAFAGAADLPPAPSDSAVRQILAGPPYQLDAEAEESLGWWAQAASWLRPIAPDSPSPAEIARTLERRHFEGWLQKLGAGIVGRGELLGQLRDWYGSDEGPLVLHGIGGMGKSAVMSRFVLDHAAGAVVAWLDFDRPDLAPEDAHSVIAAIHRMAALRVPLAAHVPDVEWTVSADRLGHDIASTSLAAGVTARPLLILDSFEAAQYSEQYQELWPVIDRLATWLPDLKVCVTGRAPVPALQVAGKPAVQRQLPPLSPDDERAFLAGHGIADPALVAAIVALTRGIPLQLQLAVRAVAAGDRLEDAPANLQASLVTGFLQRRILQRLKDRRLADLAEGALVLRRLSEDMIGPVIGPEAVPVDRPATQAFRELGRELGLVEPGSVLRVRPEVRSTALALLRLEKPDWVMEIDRRAARWYATVAAPERWQCAELIYHRLRLGDLAGASAAWTDDCAPLLTDVDSEELGSAGWDWLSSRLGASMATAGAAPDDAGDLAAWEDDALRRILEARGRGLERIVLEILKERAERSADSRLIFHEAFALREQGRSDAARDLLADIGTEDGPAGRERCALAALLARDRCDRAEADHVLAPLCDEKRWVDRAEPRLLALVAAAARLQLCVDLDTEIELLRSEPSDEWAAVQDLLKPSDILLPLLRERLDAVGAPATEAASADVVIEIAAFDWAETAARILTSWEEGHPGARAAFARAAGGWRETGPWRSEFDAERGVSPQSHLAATLASLAWRRAFLLIDGIFPLTAIEECRSVKSSWNRLGAALLGTVALFARPLGDVRLLVEGVPLADAVRAAAPAAAQLAMSLPAWETARAHLAGGVDPDHDWSAYAHPGAEGEVVIGASMLTRYRGSRAFDPDGAIGAFLYALVAPDPLTSLVEELAGVPARVAQTSAAQVLGAVQASSVVAADPSPVAIANAFRPAERPPAPADDPNKRQFGERAANEWATIAATVSPFAQADGWFRIELVIRAASETALGVLAGKTALVHLHPTFPGAVQHPVFDGSGTIRLPLIAYGAFTVGVDLPDGCGQLELDLAEIDAPEMFRSR